MTKLLEAQTYSINNKAVFIKKLLHLHLIIKNYITLYIS